MKQVGSFRGGRFSCITYALPWKGCGMKPKDVVLSRIRHEETDRTPYSLHMEESVAARLERHYGTDTWKRRLVPYIQAVAAVDTNRQVPADNGRMRDPYGGIWRTDRRPWHLEVAPLSEPSLEGYTFPTIDAFITPGAKDEARRQCEESADSFLIGSLGWGLFERSWNLRGFQNALVDAATEPTFYGELLDKLTELYLDFVDYTIDLPVDGIMFGDDWGDQRGVILGPDRWRKLIKPRWKRIYDAVHSAGKIVLSHSCGSVADIMPDIIDIGLDVLESVQPEAAGMNPYRLKQSWGDRITFWGCLGSQSTIPWGTPDQIRAEIQRLAGEMSRGGGYILAPAKPLQPETPVENAVAVVEAFAAL